jgi:hypothetical protein
MKMVIKFGRKLLVEIVMMVHIPFSRQMMVDILLQEGQLLLEKGVLMYT